MRLGEGVRDHFRKGATCNVWTYVAKSLFSPRIRNKGCPHDDLIDRLWFPVDSEDASKLELERQGKSGPNVFTNRFRWMFVNRYLFSSEFTNYAQPDVLFSLVKHLKQVVYCKNEGCAIWTSEERNEAVLEMIRNSNFVTKSVPHYKDWVKAWISIVGNGGAHFASTYDSSGRAGGTIPERNTDFLGYLLAKQWFKHGLLKRLPSCELDPTGRFLKAPQGETRSTDEGEKQPLLVSWQFRVDAMVYLYALADEMVYTDEGLVLGSGGAVGAELLKTWGDVDNPLLSGDRQAAMEDVIAVEKQAWDE